MEMVHWSCIYLNKGAVLPIGGIIMITISIVAVYMIAQQDASFTKSVVFKGYVLIALQDQLVTAEKTIVFVGISLKNHYFLSPKLQSKKFGL